MNVERTCVVCRKKGTKDNFIKVVFNKNKEVFIEKDKKIDGRGAYICKNIDCVTKCLKNKSLSKSFKYNIPQEFYEEILNYFGTCEN